MRAKLVTFGFTAVAVIALALQALPQAIAQGNANKPAAPKKAKPAAAKPAPKPPATAEAQMTTPAAKPAAKKRRPKKTAMRGVPSGVPNCLKHLSEMASKDPLIAYEGHPEEIVNNGLMWNDPKSKCSIGTDESMRKKVAEMAKAWRMKDATTVRSIIADLQSSAGPK